MLPTQGPQRTMTRWRYRENNNKMFCGCGIDKKYNNKNNFSQTFPKVKDKIKHFDYIAYTDYKIKTKCILKNIY